MSSGEDRIRTAPVTAEKTGAFSKSDAKGDALAKAARKAAHLLADIDHPAALEARDLLLAALGDAEHSLPRQPR